MRCSASATRYDAEHVPVIVVTALDDGDVVSTALEGGRQRLYLQADRSARADGARQSPARSPRTRCSSSTPSATTSNARCRSALRICVSANETLSAEIGEREAAEARAQSLARHDPLTGLANRRHFLEELERRLALVGGDEDALRADVRRSRPLQADQRRAWPRHRRSAAASDRHAALQLHPRR